MKIGIMEKAMWALFRPTFQKHTSLIGVDDPAALMKKAERQYYEILKGIPEYGQNDILLINLVSAAMYASVYMSLEQKPTIDKLADYYENAMNTNMIMKMFLKSTNYYSKRYQTSLKKWLPKVSFHPILIHGDLKCMKVLQWKVSMPFLINAVFGI